MIRTASVWHGKDGYTLEVCDIPMWAYLVDAANDTLISTVCELTRGWGCPLCLCNHAEWAFKAGWGRDEDGLRRHSLGGALFWLGQRGGRFHLNRQRTVYSRALTFDEVREHFPDSRVAVDYDDHGNVIGIELLDVAEPVITRCLTHPGTGTPSPR